MQPKEKPPVSVLPALQSRENALQEINSLPAGPSISGKVSLTLADLDKMRADHAALRQLSEDLLLHRKEVRVTIMEKKTYEKYAPSMSRYESGRYVTDSQFVEIGVEYRNLVEIQSNIESETQAKYKTQIDTLTEEAGKLKKAQSQHLQDYTDKVQELEKKHKEKLQEFKVNAEDVAHVQALKLKLKASEERENALQLKNENLKRDLEKVDLDFAKYKYNTSWWYRLWH